MDPRHRRQVVLLQRLLRDDHHARGAVADLAGGGRGDPAALLQQLHRAHAVQADVEADAFVDVVADDLAFLVQAVDGQDLVLEGAALRGRDGALVGEVAELVELILGQAVLSGDHLGAHELAELDVGIALFHPRALRNAEAFLGGQRHRQAHRHAGHALDARGDHDVLGAAEHALGGEVQRLLRGAALAVDRGARHAFRKLGREHRVARDVGGLLAHLHHAAHHHVLDGRGIDAGAIHQLVQHLGGQIRGVPPAHAPALAASGGPGRGDDIGLSHGKTPSLRRLRRVKTTV